MRSHTRTLAQSDFVGISVDEVRVRTEVSLDAHGRNLASEAMSEQ